MNANKINLTAEEYEALKRKGDEAEKAVDTKVATAMWYEVAALAWSRSVESTIDILKASKVCPSLSGNAMAAMKVLGSGEQNTV
ncbi:hypothetical protein Tco_0319678 [Tanacetum coccineum]